jgi:hypothetical protein
LSGKLRNKIERKLFESQLLNSTFLGFTEKELENVFRKIERKLFDSQLLNSTFFGFTEKEIDTERRLV